MTDQNETNESEKEETTDELHALARKERVAYFVVRRKIEHATIESPVKLITLQGLSARAGEDGSGDPLWIGAVVPDCQLFSSGEGSCVVDASKPFPETFTCTEEIAQSVLNLMRSAIRMMGNPGAEVHMLWTTAGEMTDAQIMREEHTRKTGACLCEGCTAEARAGAQKGAN